MYNQQLSAEAFKAIWSALHAPNEPNHCGKKILELCKYNAMSAFQKSIFEDLEKNRNFSNAPTVITEISNLMEGNGNMMNEVSNALKNGAQDSKMPMPEINMEPTQTSQYQTTSNDDSSGGRIIGALFFFGGLFLTFASDGQAIFYGAIIYGLIKMITG